MRVSVRIGVSVWALIVVSPNEHVEVRVRVWVRIRVRIRVRAAMNVTWWTHLS